MKLFSHSSPHKPQPGRRLIAPQTGRWRFRYRPALDLVLALGSVGHWVRQVWRAPLQRYRLRVELTLAAVFTFQLQVLAMVLRGPDPVQFGAVLLLGLPIGMLIGLLEVRVFPRFLTRVRLPLALVLSLSLHLLLLVGFVELARSIDSVLPALPSWSPVPEVPEQFEWGSWAYTQTILAYTLALVGTTVLHQVGLMVGPRVLVGLLLGRYHQPVAEHRVFLFLDLKDSTALAERLGERQYSQLVSDFFHDLNAAVLATRGEIYQYVGDEAVVTWLTPAGAPQARCLHCFFVLDAALRRRRRHYLRRYGLVPEFKAGAHLGRVMTTQVGDVKRDIVYHGDVLNTAARIQAQCNALGSRFLISEELQQRLEPLAGFQLTAQGQIVLRGKQHPVRLVDVQFTPSKLR